MTENDRDQFVLLIQSLASAHAIEPTTALQLGYWLGLKDLSIEDVERAVGRALCESRFMPKPVELRALAGVMSSDQRAVLAWDALRKAIGRHGSYASVDFDDPVINATVRNLGGWSKICATGNEEFEKWTRKDFERVYSALCQSGVTTDSSRYLSGSHETQNSALGYEIEPPSRVVTGLPAHEARVLRELMAPARLVLAGLAEKQSENKNVIADMVRRVAER